jgi:PAS domain-containing protein
MVARTPKRLARGWNYQRLFDAVADPLFVLDVSQRDAIRIVTVNAASASFFGVPARHS